MALGDRKGLPEVCLRIGPAADAERGSIVKADVVLRDGVAPDGDLAKALQKHVKREIAPYKCPRAIASSSRFAKRHPASCSAMLCEI